MCDQCVPQNVFCARACLPRSPQLADPWALPTVIQSHAFSVKSHELWALLFHADALERHVAQARCADVHFDLPAGVAREPDHWIGTLAHCEVIFVLWAQ